MSLYLLWLKIFPLNVWRNGDCVMTTRFAVFDVHSVSLFAAHSHTLLSKSPRSTSFGVVLYGFFLFLSLCFCSATYNFPICQLNLRLNAFYFEVFDETGNDVILINCLPSFFSLLLFWFLFRRCSFPSFNELMQIFDQIWTGVSVEIQLITAYAWFDYWKARFNLLFNGKEHFDFGLSLYATTNTNRLPLTIKLTAIFLFF